MEVCPPAETCRDAFERMSRATVRMGSKGFASQTVGGGSLTGSTKALASTPAGMGRTAAQTVQLTPTPRAAPRRPTFDMDLSDLYSNPVMHQQQHPQQQQGHANPSTGQPPYQASQPLATQSEQYRANPGFHRTYSTGYEQTSPQQQQQQYYLAQSPQSVGSAAAPAFTPPASAEQQPGLTDISLDFLDFSTNPIANNMSPDTHMGTADGGASSASNQFAGSFSMNDIPGTGNINLGSFGTEVDYLRDLTTDGSGYDLMDGYWFGMPGGGNSGI